MKNLTISIYFVIAMPCLKGCDEGAYEYVGGDESCADYYSSGIYSDDACGVYRPEHTAACINHIVKGSCEDLMAVDSTMTSGPCEEMCERD